MATAKTTTLTVRIDSGQQASSGTMMEFIRRHEK